MPENRRETERLKRFFAGTEPQEREKVFSVADMLKSALILLAASGVGIVFDGLGLSEVNIITVYILGVLITSIYTRSHVYSLVASLVSVVVFNFLFIDPRYTFMAYDSDYPVTFVIMFAAALITGSLAARLKRNAKQSAQAAFRTKILFETNQLLQQAKGREAVAEVAARQLTRLLSRTVVVYLAERDALGAPRVFPADGELPPAACTDESERAVACWVMQNNRQAGATTDTQPGAKCLYLSMRVNDNVYGVLGVLVGETALDTFENSIMLSILGESAMAMENQKNAEEKEAAAILAKNEQLRANLLRAISHDLRTPLTSISGNASNLMSNSASFDEAAKHRIYADIYDNALWLAGLVENLLSVTRLEEGRMNLRMSAELLDDVVAEALRHVNNRGVAHTVSVVHKNELLLARMDAKLIVQVIINLVDNAIKYTPEHAHIEITTMQAGDRAVVRVADDGPGIPEDMKPHVFDMFYSGANKIVDSRRSMGLGLSLCRSIITAHGGQITLSDNVPHGAVFTFTLAAEEAHLHG